MKTKINNINEEITETTTPLVESLYRNLELGMITQKEENANFQEQLTDLKKEKSVLSQMIAASFKRVELLSNEVGHYWSVFAFISINKIILLPPIITTAFASSWSRTLAPHPFPPSFSLSSSPRLFTAQDCSHLQIPQHLNRHLDCPTLFITRFFQTRPKEPFSADCWFCSLR